MRNATIPGKNRNASRNVNSVIMNSICLQESLSSPFTSLLPVLVLPACIILRQRLRSLGGGAFGCIIAMDRHSSIGEGLLRRIAVVYGRSYFTGAIYLD